MLINCPECNKEISDKAYACPNCGYPINNQPQQNTRQNAPRATSKRYSRLPNHYGSIRFLSGNRRKPYGAYPPVTEYKDNGTAVTPKALGFFETYNQALECLAKYNSDPYDVSTSRLTFSEVFEMYYEDKFIKNKKKVYSKSSINSTRSAFNNLSALHSVPMKELRTNQMQMCIDNSTLRHASLEIMVNVLKQVSVYALQRDIIIKDYAQYITINIADDDEKGIPFSENDLKILWEHKEDKTVQYILIMIYTGMRISELEKLELHLDDGYVVGGLKTSAGKNRIIPIHDAIKPFADILNTKMFKAGYFRDSAFYPTLNKLGIAFANESTKHTPHDCRHTFSWLCDKYKVDDLTKHLIMGHSIVKMDIEKSVYGHRTIEELKEEIKKIRVSF